jgi:adenylosuccinate synthase
MFDPKTTCLVVVGAQWGDEGKGKLVDVLAERADLVVRYQGGANAGHTVVIGDKQFVLRQIPSGILHPQVTCLIGNGVVLEPENLFSELDSLHERGVDTTGRLYISDRAHLVLPYHKLLDAASEKSQKLGTTGRGIGPAYEDKYGRRGIRVVDLRRLECASAILQDRVTRANQLLELMGSAERAHLEAHIRLLERLAPRILPLAADAGLLIYRAVQAQRRVLLEGAQGALLDVDHGTYPYVTSSNTLAAAAALGAGTGADGVGYVLGITKAYTTRVGSGPFPTELDDEVGRGLGERGHEFGTVTGRARRCGWFDAVLVRQAVKVGGIHGLALTKLDVLDGMAQLRICTAYCHFGQTLHHLPAGIRAQAGVEPIYEELDGWRESTRGARSFAELPAAAVKYVKRLEELVEAPVALLSTSPDRQDTILLRDPFAD